MAGKLNLDIQTILDKRFDIDFKGYSGLEVDTFLDLVIEDYQTYQDITAELNQKIAEQYDALHCTLEPEQKEMLIRLMELNGESDTMGRLDSFVVGFRLGAACICDALLADDSMCDIVIK